jgi:hypothetical protein
MASRHRDYSGGAAPPCFALRSTSGGGSGTPRTVPWWDRTTFGLRSDRGHCSWRVRRCSPPKRAMAIREGTRVEMSISSPSPVPHSIHLCHCAHLPLQAQSAQIRGESEVYSGVCGDGWQRGGSGRRDVLRGGAWGKNRGECRPPRENQGSTRLALAIGEDLGCARHEVKPNLSSNSGSGRASHRLNRHRCLADRVIGLQRCLARRCWR